ncbi:hypothetical protein [Cohnella hashimotonis]|uniref:YfhD family protein n=1 Tax=Cohnella hashimotonis TaxID=2826895 RepID=A0ABT6TCC4_9BACL|nr:hypothetical protein [Cohnella hashimotonis]MDI4643599.1 hypothetical protein [Cohnella hashimotonis]
MKKGRRLKMPTAATKPIRPTKASFNSSEEKQKFIDYATQTKKTESVGMDKVREMVRNHREKRK